MEYEYKPVPVEQLADYLQNAVEHADTFLPVTFFRNVVRELYDIKKNGEQVVPTFDQWLETSGRKPLGWVKDAMRESYDGCRDAFLAGKAQEQVPAAVRDFIIDFAEESVVDDYVAQRIWEACRDAVLKGEMP